MAAYKRGILVFVFFISALSVYHFSASQEGPGVIYEMKRSLVSGIRIPNIAP